MEEIEFAAQLLHNAVQPTPMEATEVTLPASPFVIIRQNSLSIEQIYKNGLPKKVHVVVKNHPFIIQVGLASTTWEGQKMDFTKSTMEARLVYDTDTLKEVSFVKMKPLEFKCHVNERGDQVTAEIRPKVLTSQLEDMLFRVKFVAVDSARQQIGDLCVFSEPIKVVSKPEQVKKRKKPPTEVKQKPPPPPKEDKTKINDLLTDELSKIDAQCDENQNLLSILDQTLQSNSDLYSTLASNVTVNRPAEKPKLEQPRTTSDLGPFELAFLEFVEAYDRLDPEEKPSKIRKVIKNTSNRDIDYVTDMLEVFTQTAATTQPDHSKSFIKDPNMKTCNCQNCSHLLELRKIDDFYNRFLITSDGIL